MFGVPLDQLIVNNQLPERLQVNCMSTHMYMYMYSTYIHCTCNVHVQCIHVHVHIHNTIHNIIHVHVCPVVHTKRNN